MHYEASGRPDSPTNTIQLKAILLVDDDKQLASALQWILADEDFLVDVAHNGEEAMLKVQALEYDVVICDLMMPRLRGDEFFHKAKEIRPNLGRRFVFITGFAADPEISEFLTGNDVEFRSEEHTSELQSRQYL